MVGNQYNNSIDHEQEQPQRNNRDWQGQNNQNGSHNGIEKCQNYGDNKRRKWGSNYHSGEEISYHNNRYCTDNYTG